MLSPYGLALLFLALITVVSAQKSSATSPLDAYPDCGLHRRWVYSGTLLTDKDCICSDPLFRDKVMLCVESTCTIPDALITRNESLANCGSPIRDRSPELFYITIPLTCFIVIFVILRFASIIYARLGCALDDWLMLATLCVTVPSASINIYGLAGNGHGKDIWTLPPEKITGSIFFFYQTAWMYFLATTLVKLSIIAFYLRIFPQTSTRRLLWGTFVLTSMWGAVFVGFILLQCHPVSYFWDRWDGMHEGKCLDGNDIAWAHASTNIALELWVMAIPLSELRKSQLRWRRKIGIAFMFSLGIFVTIMSCLRLKSLINLAKTQNKTWEYLDVTTWSTIELCVSIVCGCLPAARLFIVRLFPCLGGVARNTSDPLNPFKSRSRALGLRNRSPHGNSIHITAAETQMSGDGTNRGHGIKFHKTYDVLHMDTDETSLMPMHHMGVPGVNRPDP